MSGIIVLIGLVVAFALLFWGVSTWFAEVERRLARDLSWLEIWAIVMCMPYSLLVLFLLPDQREKR